MDKASVLSDLAALLSSPAGAFNVWLLAKHTRFYGFWAGLFCWFFGPFCAPETAENGAVTGPNPQAPSTTTEEGAFSLGRPICAPDVPQAEGLRYPPLPAADAPEVLALAESAGVTLVRQCPRCWGFGRGFDCAEPGCLDGRIPIVPEVTQ